MLTVPIFIEPKTYELILSLGLTDQSVHETANNLIKQMATSNYMSWEGLKLINRWSTDCSDESGITTLYCAKDEADKAWFMTTDTYKNLMGLT
jgi:hypothetical protein